MKPISCITFIEHMTCIPDTFSNSFSSFSSNGGGASPSWRGRARVAAATVPMARTRALLLQHGSPSPSPALTPFLGKCSNTWQYLTATVSIWPENMASRVGCRQSLGCRKGFGWWDVMDDGVIGKDPRAVYLSTYLHGRWINGRPPTTGCRGKPSEEKWDRSRETHGLGWGCCVHLQLTDPFSCGRHCWWRTAWT